MARTTINSLGVPAGTITAADLTFPLTDFSSTGIDDNASSTSLTIDSSGNISVTGTVDGRDLATDGTKLDGIEASADVTDTANVTAAGALMDSELTDLAGVKGVTISTLQPKPSEGAFANGDKTKLDGIATGADVTPSWVPSSDPSYLTSFDITTQTDPKYLRSDTSDTMAGDLTISTTSAVPLILKDSNATGNSAAIYMEYHDQTNTRVGYVGMGSSSNGDNYLYSTSGSPHLYSGNSSAPKYNGNTIWHAGNDGSGSGLDADTLDGSQASAFAALSGATFTGATVIDHNTSPLLSIKPTNGSPWAIDIARDDLGSSRVFTHNYSSAGLGWVFEHMPYDYNAGSPGKLWGATNDGSGSGLDADLLDGQQGSYYLNTSTSFGGDVSGTYNAIAVTNDSHNHTNFSVAGITDLNSISGVGATIFRPFVSEFQASNRSGANYNGGFDVGTRATNYRSQFVFEANGATTPPKFRNLVNGTWGGWYALWHTGNDGSGSGLDADTVDGIEGSNILTLSGTQTVTGVKTFSVASGNVFKLNDTNASTATNANIYFYFQANGSNLGYIGYGSGSTNYLYVNNPSAPIYLAGSSVLLRGGYEAWGTDNDGSGSGLDADTVDGIQAASLARNDTNVTFDNGTSTTVTVLCDNSGEALLALRGDGQGTGRLFVGQNTSYGGGIEYNGDNSPSTTGAGADYIALYRMDAGTLAWTARNYYNSNDWSFRGNISAYASDERLKENIQVIPNALEKVASLKGVTFDWRADVEEKGFLPSQKHETGVIAQDVAKVVPDAAVPAPFDENYLTVQHEKLIPLLIEAIKEQQAQINELKEIIKCQ